MNAFWKIVFFLYNLLLIAAGGVITLMALGYADYMSAFSAAAGASSGNRMMALTIGLGMILIALIMILLSVTRKNRKTIVVKTSGGQKATISVKAAQNMVLQSLLGMPGIREVTPEIQGGGSGISVRLHVTVESQNNVPKLCEEAQKRVVDHLRDVSGLKVGKVSLLIENIVPSGRRTEKARKEVAAMKAKIDGKASDKKPMFGGIGNIMKKPAAAPAADAKAETSPTPAEKPAETPAAEVKTEAAAEKPAEAPNAEAK